jgi:DNA-binding HxlR family transcriptional regulator
MKLTLHESVASRYPEPVLPRTYAGQNCSIARTLELVGERWTMLVLREAFLGRRRFDEYAERLGIARNVLSARLAHLVEEGVLERVRYQERPERFEYRLTDKGLDLWPVLFSLLHYGDRHYAPDGPPMALTHRGCGGELSDRRVCRRCGAALEGGDVEARRGPGALSAAAPARA